MKTIVNKTQQSKSGAGTLSCLLFFLLFTAFSLPNRAMTIVRTDAASMTTNLTPADKIAADAAFDYAAAQICALYNNNIQINITIAAGGGLGGSSSFLSGTFTYAQIKTFLQNASGGANDASAVSNLPATDPVGGTASRYFVTRAQAKALGIIASDASTDGTFTFGFAQTYTYDPNNRAVSGAYDFIGVAEHEITEIMGRIPGLGDNIFGTTNYDIFDLFRYTAPGVHSLDANDNNVYFSINNGTTNLNDFNFPNGNGSDPQDWAGNTVDACNAFGTPGSMEDITAVDIQVMDVIGYSLITGGGAVAPAFTSCVSSPQTANTLSNSCHNTVNYSSSEVVTGSPTPTITYSFSGATTGSGNGNGSGSSFNNGTTTVTLTATNTSGTASCTFNVVVTDNTNPTITAPANVISCTGNSISLGTPTTADNCTVASVTSNAPGSFSTGTTSVIWTVTDGNGNTATVTQSVTVNPTPTMTCPGTQSASTGTSSAVVNYSATAGGSMSPTISYSFSGATTGNGSGTGSGSAFNIGTTVVALTATNTCGNTASCSFNVVVTAGGGCTSAPATPGAIAGPNAICTLTSATYSITPLSGATSYTWTIATGSSCMSIVSGQGTTSINVGITSNNLNLWVITVSATNACGTSGVASLSLTKKPQTPANITGPTDICGMSSATYSIPTTPGATSYAWVVPAGMTITGGTGTNSITVNIATTFTQGAVKVSAVNACGSIPGTALAVYGKVPPTSITGPANVCGMTSATYTCNTVSNATSYGWVVPASWTFTGQGTTTIIATMPANVNNITYSGLVKVHAISGCGNSADKTFTVSYCRSAEAMTNGAGEENSISIYPNPTTGELGIRNYESGIGNVEVYNVIGECVYKSKIVNTESTINISDLSKGMYLVRLIDADSNVIHSQTVIKQ